MFTIRNIHMYLVKLNAINSTSSYLRQIAKNTETKNWTVVTADFQSQGRGQKETNWISEKGKNLLCSILIKLKELNVEHNFYLNCAISIGIYKALSMYNLDSLSIKWPNDIMSGASKLGGILIENSLKKDLIYQTIVGLGLNINQESFSDDIPNPISMKNISKINYSIQDVLEQVVKCIKNEIDILNNNMFQKLHSDYENLLYKNGESNWFKTNLGVKFKGIIIGVSTKGLLNIKTSDQDILQFDHKEIKFL